MLSIIITVLIIFGIIYFIFINISQQEKWSDTEEPMDKEFICEDELKEEISDEIENFDKLFFEETKKGETYQHFLSLSSIRDCSFIRGLLQVEGISTYTEGEHMNSIYGGISGTMNAVVAIKLYILSKDYDKAYEIVKDFINEKIQRITNDDENKKSNMASVALVFLSSTPVNVGQKSLGIVVLPKVEENN